MPTRKIADPPKFNTCRHPEHRPPAMRVFAPGTYEHTCPSCGNKMVFVVPPGPTLECRPECDRIDWKPPAPRFR